MSETGYISEHATRNGFSPSVLPSAPRQPRAVVAIADSSARQHAVTLLEQLRWTATPAGSGAQAFAYLEHNACQALLLDSWLPDLEMSEFVSQCRSRYPAMDLVLLDELSGVPDVSSEAGINGARELTSFTRHPRRQELLYVLRQALNEHASTSSSGSAVEETAGRSAISAILPEEDAQQCRPIEAPLPEQLELQTMAYLPEFVGSSLSMRKFTRLVRLVAPRRTPVLIEGPTGTGKELTARAVHRLSPRASKPMVVLNCAAIPEALLEAEVFGHTRGAFTGAVSSRTGRVEAAHGGTLFLDEIGDMPLQLQSKLLRFLESGELQRVGENELIQVDVRVIAATNQPLVRRVAEGSFRADLYYRLSVFPIATPALLDHAEDIPQLAKHFLKRHSQTGPAKEFGPDAMHKLRSYRWPGNVRELEHCVERAYILADNNAVITASEIQFGAF